MPDKIIPEEVIDCLKDEPKAYQRFRKLTKEEQKLHLDIIMASKNQDTKVEKIVKLIESLNY